VITDIVGVNDNCQILPAEIKLVTKDIVLEGESRFIPKGNGETIVVLFFILSQFHSDPISLT
jgi:hypothetical protein